MMLIELFPEFQCNLHKFIWLLKDRLGILYKEIKKAIFRIDFVLYRPGKGSNNDHLLPNQISKGKEPNYFIEFIS